MVLDCYMLQKKSTPDQVYYHTTFAIHCADGWYDFGFFNHGKSDQSHSNGKTVEINKSAERPNCVHCISLGQTKLGLQKIVDFARGLNGKRDILGRLYTLGTHDCGTFVESIARLCGVDRKLPDQLNMDWGTVKMRWDESRRIVDELSSSYGLYD